MRLLCRQSELTTFAGIRPDHWCWSGTNSKGKSGIFPKAYVDTDTMEEPPTSSSTRAGSLYEEKLRSSTSMMAKFSVRKNSARPPSISGSSISH